MKKIMLFLMLVFVVNTTSAEGEIMKSPVKIETTLNSITVTMLKPITPVEATFEETILDSINIYNLKPVTPKEATFEE